MKYYIDISVLVFIIFIGSEQSSVINKPYIMWLRENLIKCSSVIYHDISQSGSHR